MEEAKKRTPKTAAQLMALEKAYAENKSPPEPLRLKLSKELGLLDQQIHRWFRYQRQKEQKKEALENNEDQGVEQGYNQYGKPGLPALQDYPSPTFAPEPSVKQSAREVNFCNLQKIGVNGSTSNSSLNAYNPCIKSSPESYNLSNDKYADLEEIQSRKRTRKFSAMDMGNTFPGKELKLEGPREQSNGRYLNSKEPHNIKRNSELTDMDLETVYPMTMHNLSRPDELKQKYPDLKWIQDMKRNEKQLCNNMESAFLKNMHYEHAVDALGKEELFNSRAHNIQGNAELSIVGMMNTNGEDLELGGAADGLRKNHLRAESLKRNGQPEIAYQRNMQECLSSRRTPDKNRNGEFSCSVLENAYGRKVEIPSAPLLKSCNRVDWSGNNAETSIQRMHIGRNQLEKIEETLYKSQKHNKTSECLKEKLMHHDKTSEYSKEELLEHFLKIRDYPSAVLVTEFSDYDILNRKIRKEAVQSPQETNSAKSPSVSLSPADRNPGCKMSQERGLSLISRSLKSKKNSEVRESLGRLYQVDGPPLTVNFDQLPSHAFSAISTDYATS